MSDFDWTQIDYLELWRWINPRIRSRSGKKVKTKTFGYIDYFPNGTNRSPMLYDMLNSRDIPFTMQIDVATRHNSDNIGIITLCFDRNYVDTVGNLIANLDKQIKVLYGEDKAKKYIQCRANTYQDMFGDYPINKLNKLVRNK